MSDRVVSSGQSLSGQDIAGGDSLVVLAGGSIVDATIEAHASDAVYGMASHTTLMASASETVFANGMAIGTKVGSGAAQYVSGGGAASATDVQSGGQLYVNSNGVAQSAIIENGGLLSVSSGGFASAADIHSGGSLLIEGGGLASDTVIEGGGAVTVLFGAQTLMDKVSGTLTASSGSVVTEAQVQSGGTLVVDSGGFGTATIVSAGGLEVVSSGGFASATQFLSGASGVVMGKASDAVLNSFAFQTISAGGVALGTTVGSAAAQIVSGGGLASATDVQSGGEMYVLSLGAVQGATIEDGGLVTVSSGGAALDMIVTSNGTMALESGGFGSGATIEDNGWVIVSSGAQSLGDTVLSGGMIIASAGGAVTATAVSAGGYVVVSSGGEADDVVISSGGMEVISAGGQANNTHLLASGKIDFDALTYVSGATATFDGSTDILTIQAGDVTNTISLAGDYQGLYFHLSKDVADGSLVLTVDGTPCYCRGTRIMTQQGEIAVEDLNIGDLLVTASGEARPLRWIGRRTYTAAMAAGDAEILPVMIRAGALAEHVPCRDLFVSPLHAMFIDGKLVPAISLVNGLSIVQAASIDSVDYFHLELETHDVILADGAPSESFVDDGSRSMFHNIEDYHRLYPDAETRPAVYCAPRLEDGEELESLRERLLNRARSTGASPVGLWPVSFRGHLDIVSHDVIRGWARDTLTQDRVRLRILDNGRTIGTVDANAYRQDLHASGQGDGWYGFEFAVPGGLDPHLRHVIQVQNVVDQADVLGSPVFLDASSAAANGRGTTGILMEAPEPEILGASQGYLDCATHKTISGWAWNPEQDMQALAVRLFANGRLLSRVVANALRPDLMASGIGTGRYGFELDIDGVLDPMQRYVIQAFVENSGRPLLGAPMVVEPANSFNEAFAGSISRVFSALASQDDRVRALEFMLAQAERVKQQMADAEAGRETRQRSQRRKRALGPVAASLPTPARRALVVDDRFPAPSRDAGSNALLSHIRALQALGYAISFVSTEGFGAAISGADIDILRLLGVSICGAPVYGTVEEVLRRQAGCFDLVYMHRISTAGAYMKLARQTMPRARILYSVADLHHLRLSRQAEAESRPELLGLSNRTRLEEFTAAWQADAVLTHSSVEADILRRSVPAARVYETPWEHRPLQADPEIPFSDRSGIMFLGNYGHQPNEDAACWLVECVMPLVWRKDPSIRCLLVGAGMTQRVRDIAQARVEIMGHVSDLDALWACVRLSVAPLRYGAGVKGKVLESMAAGVPCVMTGIAAEGLALPAILREWVGDNAQDLADRIVALHGDEALFRRAGGAGAAYIVENFSADAVRDALAVAIEGRCVAAAGDVAAE